MARENGQTEFRERVQIRFKQGKSDSQSAALIGEMIEFLELKVSMGVHLEWIKRAIFDQFMRERSGGAAPSIEAVIKSRDADKVGETAHVAAQAPSHEPLITPSGQGEGITESVEVAHNQPARVSETTDLRSEVSEDLEKPKRVKGLPRGMATIMGE